MFESEVAIFVIGFKIKRTFSPPFINYLLFKIQIRIISMFLRSEVILSISFDYLSQ